MLDVENHGTTAGRRRPNILLVEDDVDLCSLMKDYFDEHQIVIEAVHDGRSGLARALDRDYDLVILDVMIPVLDGFEVLRQLRRRKNVPVIMLTARTEKQDRIAGLDAGADDYLPKPFSPDELIARIRAVLRRSGQTAVSAGPVQVGGFVLNSENRELFHGDKRIDLTSTEFDIADVLLRAAGRTVSRDELSAVLYQREATPYERSLDVHISHLRKKLETGDRALIKTIRGVGYMFSPATT